MFKLVCTALVAVVVGRWVYAEAEVVAPSVVPYIDIVLDKAQIPTHDQWSTDSVETLYKRVANVYKVASDAWNRSNTAQAEDMQ